MLFFFNWHLKTLFLSFWNLRPEKQSASGILSNRDEWFFSLKVSSLHCKVDKIIPWTWSGLFQVVFPNPIVQSLCVCTWVSAGWAGGKGWGAWPPSLPGLPLFHCCSYCTVASRPRPSIVECRKAWLSLYNHLNILTIKPSHSAAWLVYLTFCKSLPGQQKRVPSSLNT